MDIIWLFILLFIYFTPLMIAAKRGHCNIVPIMLVNLVLGWTFIGWFIALIWATTSNTRDMKAG